jgi:outer membrane biosynthesis protein TonB
MTDQESAAGVAAMRTGAFGVRGPVTLVFCLGLAGLSLAGSACAKKEAVVIPPPAPLEVPVVPPRLVGPVMVEEPELPPLEVPEPKPTRPRPRPTAAKGDDPVVKVEPPPDSTTKPNDPATPPPAAGTPAAAGPAPLLRTPDTANDAEVSRQVRATLARAGDNLNKINYNGLNQGAKGQHDTARRFIAQAEDALKSKNLVFARYLADKAENISASLINR